ncbi:MULTISPECIES: hypothetical protein [Kitasatospora]
MLYVGQDDPLLAGHWFTIVAESGTAKSVEAEQELARVEREFGG